MPAKKTKYFLPRAKVYYTYTGETIKVYPTLRGARIAATRFNQNAGQKSYLADRLHD